VSAATGIRSANLSVWLRGKEQVISAKRVAGLLYHLGVEGGRLRSDVLHQWHDIGALDNLQSVVGALIPSGTDPWLFEDTLPGLTKTRFVQAGEAWVRVELAPGATESKGLEEVVNAQRVLTLGGSLADVPTVSLQATKDEVMLRTELAAVHSGDQHLLELLAFRVDPAPAAGSARATKASPGWWQLADALHSALDQGLTPGDIAKLIDAGCEAAAKVTDRYGNPI
jgi:hypothetical protein